METPIPLYAQRNVVHPFINAKTDDVGIVRPQARLSVSGEKARMLHEFRQHTVICGQLLLDEEIIKEATHLLNATIKDINDDFLGHIQGDLKITPEADDLIKYNKALLEGVIDEIRKILAPSAFFFVLLTRISDTLKHPPSIAVDLIADILKGHTLEIIDSYKRCHNSKSFQFEWSKRLAYVYLQKGYRATAESIMTHAESHYTNPSHWKDVAIFWRDANNLEKTREFTQKYQLFEDAIKKRAKMGKHSKL